MLTALPEDQSWFPAPEVRKLNNLELWLQGSDVLSASTGTYTHWAHSHACAHTRTTLKTPITTVVNGSVDGFLMM